jgi:hypothetical protein
MKKLNAKQKDLLLNAIIREKKVEWNSRGGIPVWIHRHVRRAV